ncbi:LytTR family DNA-binding domain-containing protein [uncultured Sunxiuqinia sp.]|uniref:LytTR family DNA-binding domain-containing protein n=1 Tax=uncultured Sunxiuqinia sp. TaxID=1573825 RepID=UPI0030D7F00A|tara:strand:+ start:24640 stop:25485 length:846 start_codon:yes stop_codon:yes gene_type:complete
MGNQKLNSLIVLLKEDLRILLGIAFGIFLFILFFQPIPLEQFDFNNRLLFAGGFAAIIFFFHVLIRGLFRAFIPDHRFKSDELLLLSYARVFLITALSSVAVAFYLRYVGSVSITFYEMFKIILICLVSPVILNIYDRFVVLKMQNKSLVLEKETIRKEIQNYEDDYHNQTIEFVSEYGSDHLILSVADLLLLRSADNYVEVFYREGTAIRKQLIRSTLKNVEQQVKPFSGFVRCHRTCIVNSFHIEKLNRKFNNHWLRLKGFDDPVPVSRQYLLKIKELI